MFVLCFQQKWTACFFARRALTISIVQNRPLLPALDRTLASTAVVGCVCLCSLWLFGLTGANPARLRENLSRALRNWPVRSKRTADHLPMRLG